MLRSDPSPSSDRIAVAFSLAPGLAALLLACVVEPIGTKFGAVDPVADLAFLTLVFGAGAYTSTVVLGMPAFHLLRWRRVRLSAPLCVLMGALVATTPWLLLSLTALPDHAIDPAPGVVSHGVATFAAWLGDAAGPVSIIAGAGAVGGVLFWLIGVAR